MTESKFESKLYMQSSYLIMEIKCITGNKWNNKTNYKEKVMKLQKKKPMVDEGPSQQSRAMPS